MDALSPLSLGLEHPPLPSYDLPAKFASPLWMPTPDPHLPLARSAGGHHQLGTWPGIPGHQITYDMNLVPIFEARLSYCQRLAASRADCPGLGVGWAAIMSARLGMLFVSNDHDDHDHVVGLRSFVLQELGMIKHALETREPNPRGSGITPEGWIAQVLVGARWQACDDICFAANGHLYLQVRNDPYALRLDLVRASVSDLLIVLDSPGRPLKDERYRRSLPLFDEDIEVRPESTLNQCRHDFRSLLIEISSLNVHNGLLSELSPDDPFRILFQALQGWRVFIAAVFRCTFETDHLSTDRRDFSRNLDDLATTRFKLAIAHQLNTSLTNLLDYMWDMARNERFGAGPAMLCVIVRAPRPDQDLSLTRSMHTGHLPGGSRPTTGTVAPS